MLYFGPKRRLSHVCTRVGRFTQRWVSPNSVSCMTSTNYISLLDILWQLNLYFQIFFFKMVGEYPHTDDESHPAVFILRGLSTNFKSAENYVHTIYPRKNQIAAGSRVMLIKSKSKTARWRGYKAKREKFSLVYICWFVRHQQSREKEREREKNNRDWRRLDTSYLVILLADKGDYLTAGQLHGWAAHYSISAIGQ
jgi:hypothetical protein